MFGTGLGHAIWGYPSIQFGQVSGAPEMKGKRWKLHINWHRNWGGWLNLHRHIWILLMEAEAGEQLWGYMQVASWSGWGICKKRKQYILLEKPTLSAVFQEQQYWFSWVLALWHAGPLGKFAGTRTKRCNRVVQHKSKIPTVRTAWSHSSPASVSHSDQPGCS